MTTEKKVTTSFKIPESLAVKMLTAVVESESGLRSKSKWIEDSIHLLLEEEGYQEYVNWDITGEVNEPKKVMGVSFTLKTVEAIDQALVEVRKNFPSMEGVKSHIIRAAIVRRLLKTSNPFTG